MTVAISYAMLLPAVALVLWSLLILAVLMVGRFKAMSKMNRRLADAPRGGRGQDLESILPKNLAWRAHNYAHLMEQPTLFYPTVIVMAVAGLGNPINIGLAWAYVALRAVHSIWQVTANTIPVRFTLFSLSTGVLVALALRALFALLG